MGPYVPKRKGVRNNKWLPILDKAIKKYIDDMNWNYDISEEYTEAEVENRHLSMKFFQELIKKFYGNKYDVEIYDNGCLLIVDQNGRKNFFRFDIMNNPKIKHILGKEAKIKVPEKRLEWESIYHTIGNIAPIPRKKPKGKNISLQIRHNNLNERWDLFLEDLRKEWHGWENGKDKLTISFNDYILMTCQQMYFKKNYEDIVKIMGNRRKVDDLKDEELLDLYNKWKSKRLDESDEIISFDGDIEEAVDRILVLIQLRGRLMMLLLAQNNNIK